MTTTIKTWCNSCAAEVSYLPEDLGLVAEFSGSNFLGGVIGISCSDAYSGEPHHIFRDLSPRENKVLRAAGVSYTEIRMDPVSTTDLAPLPEEFGPTES